MADINASDITIEFSTAMEMVLYQSAEFDHLQAFLDDFIRDNYQLWIVKGDKDYMVKNLLQSEHLYHHHSYSNCVEWVFGNCELNKDK